MIEKGYLYLQTHKDHPGLVQLQSRKFTPPINQGEDEIEKTWFAARFNDIEAAKMHAQKAMRKKLVDDNLYRMDMVHAIAAVDSVNLKHEAVFTDPSIPENELREISELTQTSLLRKKRLFKFGNLIGKLAIAYLVLQMLSPLIAELFFSPPQQVETQSTDQ